MSQVDFEIRPARLQDATAIADCVASAYGHYIDRIGKPPGPMLNDYERVIHKHRVLVLTDGLNIVGVLVLIRQSRDLLLDNVAVNPSHQKRGLGRQLIAFAEKEALRMGLISISLYTNEKMTESLKLYKRLGYMETERKTEQGYRRVYMRKNLLPEIS